MKTHKHIVLILVSAVIFGSFFLSTALGQEKHGPLTQIIIYKGEAAGTGPGIGVLKLTVGEEMTVTAKGVDKDGNDVPIWPTWKADKELSIRVVEGRSKTAVVKALKEGISFFSAVYITDDGKKVIGEATVEVKPKKK